MYGHCDSRITHLPIELQIEMIRLPIECMDIPLKVKRRSIVRCGEGENEIH